MRKILILLVSLFIMYNSFAQIKYTAEKVIVAIQDSNATGKFKKIKEKSTYTIFTISKNKIRVYCEECNPYIYNFIIISEVEKDEKDNIIILTYKTREISTNKYYSFMFLFEDNGIGSIGLLNYTGTLLTYFSIKNMTD